MKRYEEIAQRLSAQIDQGLYRPGERIPGVRELSRQFEVSISTVVQAHRLLENQGRLQARPRSGYYVSEAVWSPPPSPNISRPDNEPRIVSTHALALGVARTRSVEGMVDFGAAVPADEFLPYKAFNRTLVEQVRSAGARLSHYELPPGLAALRRQIARRMALAGCRVPPEDIVITNGCQEALSLSLRILCEPGDVVAVESPAFFGLLQVIESLGLKALEIPTDPQAGVSLEALSLALAQWPVKACVFIPSFNNPLGSSMSEPRRAELVAMLQKTGVALIEDDIYGELGFEDVRPKSCKAFDETDTVLYCSSFSKTLSPGIRIGWVANARYRQALEFLKYDLTLAAPTLTQAATAAYLANGGYDRHLRAVRGAYRQLVERMRQAVGKYFPPGTRVTQPRGGFVLWVELPEALDALQLHRAALDEGISVTPGSLFSAAGKYRNCIRINCAQQWSERTEWGVATLGRITHTLCQG